MSIELTDEQKNELTEIREGLNEVAKKLRYNILAEHNQDYDSGGPLADALGLIRDAQQSLRNYLWPATAGELDWQRKPVDRPGQPPTVDAGTFSK
jgi:hypothetical protein